MKLARWQLGLEIHAQEQQRLDTCLISDGTPAAGVVAEERP